jgi:hypothetical protein
MITVGGQLDSNFYRTENNEREVYTYFLRPGIQLGLQTAKSKINFNYTLDAYFYDDKSAVPTGERSADDENYVGHLAVLDARFPPTARLTVGLNDYFYRTRRVDRYDDFTDDTGRRKHYINRLTPWIYYDFGARFSAGLRYRRQDIDYDDSEIGDSIEHRGVFDLIYNPSSTTTYDLNYQHWQLNEEQGGSDYTSDQIELTFQKRYKYFSFEAGGGYHDREFKDPALVDGDTLSYRIAIGGQNPPSPGIGRRIYESSSLGIRSYIHFDAERNFNNTGEFRTIDRYTLSLGHLFLEKIKIGLKGYYMISDYETFSGLTSAGNIEIREDDIYGISGSIRYLFKDHFNLLFSAGITDRDSNLSGFSYQNNYFTVNLEFNYPLGRKRR